MPPTLSMNSFSFRLAAKSTTSSFKISDSFMQLFIAEQFFLVVFGFNADCVAIVLFVEVDSGGGFVDFVAESN